MTVRGSCARRFSTSGAICRSDGGVVAVWQASIRSIIAKGARFMAGGSIIVRPVIIECTNCHARYQYDEDRFERKPSKKIKCAKCTTIFEIHNPAFAAKPVAAAADGGDMTYTRREPPKT